MSYLAVDRNGTENIFSYQPFRNHNRIWDTEHDYVVLPKGSIEKLIGKKLTWENEPVEINNENIKTKKG